MQTKKLSLTFCIKTLLLLFISYFFVRNIFWYRICVSITSKSSFHFTNLTQLFIDCFFAASILLICCYSIISANKESIKNLFLEKGNSSFFIVFSLAVFVVLLYNSFDVNLYRLSNFTQSGVNSFNRRIGEGLIHNYDADKVIKNFTILFLFFVCIFICLLYFFETKLKCKSENEQEAYKFTQKISVIYIACIILYIFNIFSNKAKSTEIIDYNSYILLVLLFSSIVYIPLKLERSVSFSKYICALVCLLALTIPITIIIAPEPSIKAFFSLYFWFTLFFIFGLKLNLKYDFIKLKMPNSYFLSIAIFCSLLPLITSFYIEFINVLNQHSVFIGHPLKYYIIGIILCLAITICIGFIFKHKNVDSIDIEKIIYPIFILGLSFLSVQIPLVIYRGADIFESGNSSVLISDFLIFGKIPIVENYGGHMMLGVVSGIVYGLLNNDFLGAIFSPYDFRTPVLYLSLYFLINKLLGKRYALLGTLCFPFIVHIGYWGFAILGILLLVESFEKKKLSLSIATWFWIVLTCLDRLDEGFALVETIIVIIAIVLIKERSKELCKIQLQGFFIGVGFWGVLCVLICLAKGISPFARLAEFIDISASNAIWAYSHHGNSNSIGIGFYYFVLPIGVITSIVYPLFSKEKFCNLKFSGKIILLSFAVFYFANFHRTLVRHTWAEQAFAVLNWCVFLYFAIYFFLVIHRKALFFIVQSFFFVLNVLIFSHGLYTVQPLSTVAFSQISLTQSYHRENKKMDTSWESVKKNKTKVNRVSFPKNIAESANTLNLILEDLLSYGETYADFTYRSFLYSYLGYRNPVYISQSPTMLSGEFSQKEYIKQINSPDVPIILMPTDNGIPNSFNRYFPNIGFDGVWNFTRYPKVVEFIYQNFRPLCSFEEYAIWCRNDRYEDLVRKVGCLEKIPEGITNNADIDFLEKKLIIRAVGEDPYIENFDAFINKEVLISKNDSNTLEVSFSYESSRSGILQLFYTTKKDEWFSEDKSIKHTVGESGIVNFVVPNSDFLKLRLDIPDDSIFIISDLVIPTKKTSKIDWNYEHCMHNSQLARLSYIWANYDKKKAINNKVLASAEFDGNSYIISDIQNIDKTKGNYILFQANSKRDCTATMTFADSVFTFDILSGEHSYLIRVSSDYNWYLNKADVLNIQLSDNDAIDLSKTKLSVLQGD